LVAGGLIFKGLRNYLPIITGYSAVASGCKPLKIRPLIALDGISFEISSFEEGHDLRFKNGMPILLNVTKNLISLDRLLINGMILIYLRS
jgi:hypothetical protein